jgi:hypothetical protein
LNQIYLTFSRERDSSSWLQILNEIHHFVLSQDPEFNHVRTDMIKILEIFQSPEYFSYFSFHQILESMISTVQSLQLNLQDIYFHVFGKQLDFLLKNVWEIKFQNSEFLTLLNKAFIILNGVPPPLDFPLQKVLR